MAWIFSWIFTIVLLLASANTVFFRNYPNEMLISPTKDTEWHAGKEGTIAWNSSFRLRDSMLYNDRTRVSVQLYRLNGRRHELLYTIAESFPFIYGRISWIVPNITVPERVSIDSYFVMVYPTFFDWPNSCRSCNKETLPRSDYFTIVPCTNEESCSPYPGTVTFVRPPSVRNEEYWTLVRNVCVGIGAFVALAFVIAYFVYSKQGKKTWQFYRRKRIGMLYKYQPPVGGDASSTMSDNKISPLGNFLNESTSFKDGASSVSSGTEDRRDTFPGPRHFSLINEPIYEMDEGYDSIAIEGESPEDVFTLPQHDRLPVLQNITPSSSEHSLLQPPPVAIRSPPLNAQDAIMISNTFKSILQSGVTPDSKVLLSESLASDTFSPKPQRCGTVQGNEVDSASVPEAPATSSSLVSSSPILNKLKWLAD
ncbi:hypothetical protein MP638_006504 [Amoeboaphelidium occidentale]|nr:hypothetical protein MP638_006504 [Amoeboaphelidium occidentale]